MLKKRLIFTLLLNKGVFQLSRNFSLQAVGKLDWLLKHYELESLAHSVDELVLLNVTRGEKHKGVFREEVAKLGELSFMPIAAGGGIHSVQDALDLMAAGADKLVVNSALFNSPDLVRELVTVFGSQCIVGSLDYRRTGRETNVFTENGSRSTNMTLENAIRAAEALGVGELYVTSIDRDGTGHGYDIDVLFEISEICAVPLIASGGVGDFHHFVDGLKLQNVTGASTANLFNFLGDGLASARKAIEQSGKPLARWDFEHLRQLAPLGART
jgi:cyclase